MVLDTRFCIQSLPLLNKNGMGKKRVAQKSGNAGVDDKIREQASRAEKKGKKKKVEEGFVYINATYNNIMITATDMYGNVIAWASSAWIFRTKKINSICGIKSSDCSD